MSETCDWDDLVQRDGLHYKKFTDVPFTGKTTGQQQGKIKNGKREGHWVSYHENGQLWMKGDFKNGEEEGPWVFYYDSGELRKNGEFKNGEEDGPWEYYYYNDHGQLESKDNYENGVKPLFLAVGIIYRYAHFMASAPKSCVWTVAE
mgnify:CR=1 FL=1